MVQHSDQGSWFTDREWQAFQRQRNLEPSKSRREDCHDNAVAESFFQLLKRERIRRRAYPARDDARRDVIDYFEMLYAPKRKHTNNGIRSPVEIEEGQLKLKQASVYYSRGTSCQLAHTFRFGRKSFARPPALFGAPHFIWIKARGAWSCHHGRGRNGGDNVRNKPRISHPSQGEQPRAVICITYSQPPLRSLAVPYIVC